MPTTTATDPKTPIPTTPPLNWRKEMPVYRVRVETRPAPKTRFRFEPPFAQIMDPSEWQYSERVWPAGSVIAAREVLAYFNSHQKSRLPRSPWANDQVRLEDGLGGPQPKIVAPKPEPVRLQPRQAWPDM